MNAKIKELESQESFEMSRVDYALKNPWVFQYDFGHIELIIKYANFPKPKGF